MKRPARSKEDVLLKDAAISDREQNGQDDTRAMTKEGIHPPSTRAQCRVLRRPCVRIACRYHLCTDHRLWKSIALGDLPQSCALDVADAGAHTLKQVGAMLGVTRERIRQIEAGAKRKLGDEPLRSKLGE